MSTEEWQVSETLTRTSARQYHYIIPSFLQLLKHLKETGRSFTLVFRTFGQDLPEVLDCQPVSSPPLQLRC
jgi:hypothetical protein